MCEKKNESFEIRLGEEYDVFNTKGSFICSGRVVSANFQQRGEPYFVIHGGFTNSNSDTLLLVDKNGKQKHGEYHLRPKPVISERWVNVYNKPIGPYSSIVGAIVGEHLAYTRDDADSVRSFDDSFAGYLKITLVNEKVTNVEFIKNDEE